MFDQPVNRLSGGQKTRVALAKALLSDPDLLMLDEPTNHLDLQAIEWLEGFLKSWNRAFIVVSHDRYFLNRMVTSIADLTAAGLVVVPPVLVRPARQLRVVVVPPAARAAEHQPSQADADEGEPGQRVHGRDGTEHVAPGVIPGELEDRFDVGLALDDGRDLGLAEPKYFCARAGVSTAV